MKLIAHQIIHADFFGGAHTRDIVRHLIFEESDRAVETAVDHGAIIFFVDIIRIVGKFPVSDFGGRRRKIRDKK